jgi:hypothetical protein
MDVDILSITDLGSTIVSTSETQKMRVRVLAGLRAWGGLDGGGGELCRGRGDVGNFGGLVEEVVMGGLMVGGVGVMGGEFDYGGGESFMGEWGVWGGFLWWNFEIMVWV